MPGRLDEEPHHAYECVRSAVREASEGQDRGPADHRESERGVRLRLSTLTPEKRDELIDFSPAVRFHDQTPALDLFSGLQEPTNAIDRAGDSTREEPERHNHAESDHCQDDAVLSHRLTLLDLEPCAEVMDQIRERQH